MKRLAIWTLTVCLFVFLAGGIAPAPGNAGTMDLIAKLVDALGITEKQAEGGVGALFNNAKENLSTEDFNKAAEAVPGVDEYMAEAPSTDSGGGAGGLMKSSGLSSLGGQRIQDRRHGRSGGFLFKAWDEHRNHDKVYTRCA